MYKSSIRMVQYEAMLLVHSTGVLVLEQKVKRIDELLLL